MGAFMLFCATQRSPTGALSPCSRQAMGRTAEVPDGYVVLGRFYRRRLRILPRGWVKTGPSATGTGDVQPDEGYAIPFPVRLTGHSPEVGFGGASGPLEVPQAEYCAARLGR